MKKIELAKKFFGEDFEVVCQLCKLRVKGFESEKDGYDCIYGLTDELLWKLARFYDLFIDEPTLGGYTEKLKFVSNKKLSEFVVIDRNGSVLEE